jgi:2-polyprenyl-6-methoxyphenol hydroxylase-like FAD-dependent oxidoreductase
MRDHSVTRSPRDKRVLISGASIAGPTLAYWLRRYEFDVTVVERARAVRSGGYPIDVRGTAVDVVERMGLLRDLQAAHIDTRKLTFVDAEGRPIGIIRREAASGGQKGRDLEMPRGTLTSLLFDLTQHEHTRYRFGDSIATLKDCEDGIDVTFKSGESGRFDIVIGADGLHSNTRRLVFGSEEPFIRYLGFCFAGFTVPNDRGLAHEAIIYAEPGRVAALYAVRTSPTLHAILNFSYPRAPSSNHSDEEAQRRLTAERFAGSGWETPRMVDAMLKADDLYFDSVSQIHMPTWTSGRVVLAGDAAHAPSFLSGQGSSLALVGAYVLAGELAIHEEPVEAFAAYERNCRPFVEANQALATRGGSLLLPASAEELDTRNRWLTEANGSAAGEGAVDDGRAEHNLLKLPDYGGVH